MAISTRSNQWICFLVFSLVINSVHSENSSLPLIANTVVKGAIEKGAVCLDGTPPVYNFYHGEGEGERNWLIYLSGGGWCVNTTEYDTDDKSVEHCTQRAGRNMGSSLQMEGTGPVGNGVFSSDKNANHFYNWNRVVIRYCDGGSFLGDADKPDPVTQLYYRGARIFEVVVDELMEKGLKDAQNVILAGGSAGGVGVMAHCDRFRSKFSQDIRVKCLADSSMFLIVKDPERAKFFKGVFSRVVDMQQPTKALPAECTSKMSTYECFLPQNLVKYVKSPLFIFQSAYDSFQVHHTYSEKLYMAFKNHTYVSSSDLAMLNDFRQQIKNALPKPSPTKGYILTSIFSHAFTSASYKQPMFAGKSKSIEFGFVRWYKDEQPIINLEDPSTVPYVRTY